MHFPESFLSYSFLHSYYLCIKRMREEWRRARETLEEKTKRGRKRKKRKVRGERKPGKKDEKLAKLYLGRADHVTYPWTTTASPEPTSEKQLDLEETPLGGTPQLNSLQTLRVLVGGSSVFTACTTHGSLWPPRGAWVRPYLA